MAQEYAVPHDLAGRSLAQALRVWRPELSWSQIRKLIASRRVAVGDQLCLDDARRLQEGERIAVLDEPQRRLPRPEQITLVYQDRHLVVVDKPSGIVSERRPEERGWSAKRKAKQPTLEEITAELLAQSVPRASSRRAEHDAGDGAEQRSSAREREPRPPRPAPRKRRREVLFPVHRLDRDASGLLVLARSTEVLEALRQQFQAHTVRRVYWGVVHGIVRRKTVRNRLVRDRGDGQRGSTPQEDEGQEAITHFKTLRTIGDYSLVECRLETGRTHQIRIHLSELGAPLCGDSRYGRAAPGSPLPDQSRAPHLALHACQLGFFHPVLQQWMQFDRPWPSEMASWLQRLR